MVNWSPPTVVYAAGAEAGHCWTAERERRRRCRHGQRLALAGSFGEGGGSLHSQTPIRRTDGRAPEALTLSAKRQRGQKSKKQQKRATETGTTKQPQRAAAEGRKREAVSQKAEGGRRSRVRRGEERAKGRLRWCLATPIMTSSTLTPLHCVMASLMVSWQVRPLPPSPFPLPPPARPILAFPRHHRSRPDPDIASPCRVPPPATPQQTPARHRPLSPLPSPRSALLPNPLSP